MLTKSGSLVTSGWVHKIQPDWLDFVNMEGIVNVVDLVTIRAKSNRKKEKVDQRYPLVSGSLVNSG